MTKTKYIALAGTAVSLIFAQGAQAAGTTAGTPVNNTATINYTVGSVAQPQVTSNTASFVVDKRINLTVAELGGASTVSSPGSVNQVTSFTVTNTTNAISDFKLAVTQDVGGTTAFSDTDDFNANNIRVFVDNGDGVFNAAQDTATYIDELAADASITVFVVADIPVGQVDQSTAGFTLTATAANPGTAGTLGADTAQTAGADTPGAVDVVFGDGAGDTDAARDGKFSDDDEYDVAGATITFVKTSKVISDPFNLTSNPKAIPGAVMEYCLAVTNSGSVPALGVSFADAIPANTTFLTNSLVGGGSISGGVCDATGAAEDDNNSGTDESDGVGASYASNNVAGVVNSIPASSSTTLRFRVTVN